MARSYHDAKICRRPLKIRPFLDGNTRGRIDPFGAADRHLLRPRAAPESAHAVVTLGRSSTAAGWRSEQLRVRIDSRRVSGFSGPTSILGG